ncbi:hypothetical protein [Microcoleus sp. SVA1_A1]|uniref:hypothetical protein n=1 Tax=Microcoleus sp. SVA1_A1 TaxID=2818946 RepID=UPI002FD18FCF
MAVPICAIDGSNCADGYGDYEDGEECHRRTECEAYRAYLDSPEKAESDRREAENSKRIQEALDRGEVPDPPF